MTDALDVIEPSAEGVQYAGERLIVRPLTIGQIPQLVRKARPVIDALFALDQVGDDDSDQLLGLALALIEDHGEAACEAVAIAVSVDPSVIAKGSLEEFQQLATKVLEVNRDFFVRRLGPLLAGRRQAANGSGKTASSS